MMQHYRVGARLTESLRNFWQEVSKAWRRPLVIIGWWSAKEPEKPKRKKPLRRGTDVEEAGRWYFKRDILDQLGEYFECIAELKKTDLEGYSLYSRVGAVVSSPKSLMLVDELPATWRAGLMPGFGAVSFLRVRDDDDNIPAKFICFQKLSRTVPTVEPSTGVVFSVSLFHLDIEDKRLKASMTFYVSVEGGDVRVLRELQTFRQRIRAKKIKGRKGESFTIHHRRWGNSNSLKDLYQDQKERNGIKVGIQEFGADIFRLAVGHHENSNLDIRVRVSKGNLVANFAVDMLRTPYFFADREPVFIDGIKKKIFHIVRTHPRHLKDGRTIYVHSHFRGLRGFVWNGYRVNITMPGFHHKDILGFDVGGHEFDKEEIQPTGMIDNKGLGKRLDSHMNV